MRRKMTTKLTTLVAAVSAMALLAGCGGSTGAASTGAAEAATTEAAPAGDLTIGSIFPLTGSIAADGTTCRDAVELAVKQANEAGGISGRNLAVVAEDDEGAPTSAASIANKFADDSSILAVVGSYNSSCTLAETKTFEEAGLSSIAVASTSPALTGVSKYFYRTAPNDSACGTQAADFLKELGVTKVALFYENDDYGLGLADTFKAQAEADGIEIVTTQTFVYGETVDFSTQLTSTAATDAEAIFVAGCVTEQGLICDQRADYGCGDMIMFCSNGAYTDAFLGYNTEGVYVQGEFDKAANENAKAFVDSFTAEYGYEPGNWAACAYDAANIIIEAMKNVDGDITREAINDQISKISFSGVCGDYTFENCDSSKKELMFQVTDGKFSLLQ